VDAVMTLLTKKLLMRLEGYDEPKMSTDDLLSIPAGGKSFPDIDPSDRRYLFGKKQGLSSKRPFNPDQAGLPVSPKQLFSDKIVITDKGLEMVKNHMYSFGSSKQNQLQMQRFEDILSDKIKPTKRDLDTYAHELRESLRYKRIKYRNGDDPNQDYQIWNDNHTATLEDYGLSQKDMYDLSTHVEEDY
jgi:hypothetical protein